MANLLATDSVLLVVERECRSREGVDIAQVIQRTGGGVDYATIGVEGDVAEAEGLRACLGSVGLQVFGRAEQPEEGGDDEVDGMGVEGAVDAMGSVEGCGEASQDDSVDRVGSGGRIVLVAESFEVSLE